MPSDDEDVGFYSLDALPVALGVCRESRYEILPFYPLCFAMGAQPARIRFNFELDTLSVHNQNWDISRRFFESMSPEDSARLRYLVVLENTLNAERRPINQQAFFDAVELKMKQMKSLKEASIGLDAFEYLHYHSSFHHSMRHLSDEDSRIINLKNYTYADTFTSEFPSDLVARYHLQADTIPQNGYTRAYNAWVRAWGDTFTNYVWYMKSEPYKQFCS